MHLSVRVLIPPGACNKVARYLGLGVVFAGYSGFLHQLQLASHEYSRNMAEKVMKNKIPKSYAPLKCESSYCLLKKYLNVYKDNMTL